VADAGAVSRSADAAAFRPTGKIAVFLLGLCASLNIRRGDRHQRGHRVCCLAAAGSARMINLNRKDTFDWHCRLDKVSTIRTVEHAIHAAQAQVEKIC
jgi:hypothetical protein